MTSGQTEESLYIHVPKRCFRRKKHLAVQNDPNGKKSYTYTVPNKVMGGGSEVRSTHVPDRSF